MANKVHIYVDGTWMFKACKPNGVLASKTDSSNYPFPLNWEKLNQLILKNCKTISENAELGELYYVSSIFTIPEDLDEWCEHNYQVTKDMVEKAKKVIFAKQKVFEAAQSAGYSDEGLFRPILKEWILEKLDKFEYDEKQVDTTVVALLVRGAITKPDDFHILISGDADMLPAIRVAYPEYSKNVGIVISHPDELDYDKKQSSIAFFDFSFKIESIYLQQNTFELMDGNNIYRCVECGKIFRTQNPIPKLKQPRCKLH